MLILSALNKLVQTVLAGSIASSVQYSVVSLIGHNQTLGVVVDGQTFALNVSDSTPLLYTGSAPAARTGYNYVILDNDHNIIQKENFTRAPVTESTYNEHYNRTWNFMKLDTLPSILDPLPIINRIEKDPHNDGQIPTIHITGNQSDIDYIHENPKENMKSKMKITYISPTTIKQFEDVKFSIAGHSTRAAPKLSYKFKLPKKSDLDNYRYFKLRSMSTDPSYMRDELAYDIANRIGMPTSKYSFARVYINDRAIGLFGLAEAFKSHWVENEFGNGEGKKKFKHGALYVADLSDGRSLQKGPNNHGGDDGHEGPDNNGGDDDHKGPGGHHGPGGPGGGPAHLGLADLSYLGDNITVYSIVYPPKEKPSKGDANHTRIMEFTKFIANQPNVTDGTAVPLWEEKINVDSFMRGLAHEIVTSNADGYFTMANNYMLYDDIQNERLVFSGQDFDLSMGSTMFNATRMNSGNYTEFPGLSERPLTSKLLGVPKFKQDFETLLVHMAENLVNLDVLGPRINQLSAMLLEDVEWDKTLPRVSKGLERPGGGHFISPDSSFAEAVNGSSQGMDMTATRIVLPLKEWIQLRSNNLLSFLKG